MSTAVVNAGNVALLQVQDGYRRQSARSLAREDFSGNKRSWWPKDLEVNFHDADLNYKHGITVSAYLEEYAKLASCRQHALDSCLS